MNNHPDVVWKKSNLSKPSGLLEMVYHSIDNSGTGAEWLEARDQGIWILKEIHEAGVEIASSIAAPTGHAWNNN